MRMIRIGLGSMLALWSQRGFCDAKTFVCISSEPLGEGEVPNWWTLMLRMTQAAVLSLSLLTSFQSGHSAPHRDHPIEQDIWVPSQPLPDCAVPELASRILEALSIPGGVEYLRGRCVEAARRPFGSDRVTLRGLTGTEALSKLVEFDPRYQWAEISGVIVVRPVVAWNDSLDFLHRKVSVTFTDQNIAGALTAVLNSVGRDQFHGERTLTTAQANRKFSLPVTVGSVLDVLNAIVRTHGELQWAVSYCKQEHVTEYAILLLHTFDGAGIAGRPVGSYVDSNGVRQDPCAL